MFSKKGTRDVKRLFEKPSDDGHTTENIHIMVKSGIDNICRSKKKPRTTKSISKVTIYAQHREQIVKLLNLSRTLRRRRG